MALIGVNGPEGNANLNAFAAEVAHAVAGCAVGSARPAVSSDAGCSAGAIGALVGHIAAELLTVGGPRDAAEVVLFSQLMAGIAGALIGGDQASADLAAAAGANAVENNECRSTQMCGSRNNAYGANYPLLDSTGRAVYGADGKPLSIPYGISIDNFAQMGRSDVYFWSFDEVTKL